MRADILTVTLNPAVDLATDVEQIEPDVKLRCSEPLTDPGGGGINVTRAIGIFGGMSTAMIAIGSTTGARLLELLALEGVPTVAIQGPGPTRQSISVTDRSNGSQFRFVMPGPTWAKADVDRAIEAIDRAAADGALVVLSGSQPPGVAKEFPSSLAAHVAGRSAKLIVDTSGPALQYLVERPCGGIFVLRMDDEEAEGLAGRALPRAEDTAEFAAGLVRDGVAEMVIVARGADGSILSTSDASWHANGPNVPVVSKVGAGDTFVGALTLALSRHEAPEICLQRGVAAASAAVMTEATRLCRPEDVERIFAECRLTRL